MNSPYYENTRKKTTRVRNIYLQLPYMLKMSRTDKVKNEDVLKENYPKRKKKLETIRRSKLLYYDGHIFRHRKYDRLHT